MELKDLLECPIGELNDDELERKIHLIKQLKLATSSKKKSSTPKRARKTNKELRVEDLIDSLSPDELAELIVGLQKGG